MKPRGDLEDLAQRESKRITVKCDSCGKDVLITPSQQTRNKHFFCSVECSQAFKRRYQVKLVCPICNKEFYRKQSWVLKLKNINNATCSKECFAKLKSINFTGENNHQYGLTGSKNASWKSNIRYTNNTRYTLIRSETHPFRDQANFVPEHRLIAEKYLLNETNSIEIDGQLYLRPECIVHHIDFNKKNNNVDNLYVFENESLHVLFHNLYKSGRVKNIDDFWTYYQNTYVNKLYNYQWLHKAYVDYDLSINQISKHFNIPYVSVQTEIRKTRLDEKKKQDQSKEHLMQLIINDLLNFGT